MKKHLLDSQQRMVQKLCIHRVVSSKRYAGYLWIGFSRALSKQEEQNIPFICKFPYSDPADDIGTSQHSYFSTLPFMSPGISNNFNSSNARIKRRWCVLDSCKFTCFHSRSRQKVKYVISLNSPRVRLVCPSFTKQESLSGTQSSEPADCFAIVCEEEERAIVIRAENFVEHNSWLQGFRSRFVSSTIITKMESLYGPLLAVQGWNALERNNSV